MDDRRSLSLAEIRQSRGISLEEVSRDTKISLRYLLAIEREDFSSLPGGIITTSYLRQYAAAVDYDEALLLACYVAKRKDQPEPVSPQAASRRQRAKEWLNTLLPAYSTTEPGHRDEQIRILEVLLRQRSKKALKSCSESQHPL